MCESRDRVALFYPSALFRQSWGDLRVLPTSDITVIFLSSIGIPLCSENFAWHLSWLTLSKVVSNKPRLWHQFTVVFSPS